MMKNRLLWMFAIGASLVATSCIDNDEPAGLQQMREAKAELLSANASVQLAEAELLKAQAAAEAIRGELAKAEVDAKKIANELAQAEAEHKKALWKLDEARQAAADAHQKALDELTKAIAQGQTDEELARIRESIAAKETAIELAKKQAEVDALEKEQTKLTLQQQMAESEQYHKAQMAYLLQITAANEETYQKALIDLKAALALYADNKYNEELATAIGKLQTARREVIRLQNELVLQQATLFDFIKGDEATITRNLRYNVEFAEKNLNLKKEELSLLKAAKTSNQEQWGEARDKSKSRMEELTAKSNEYEPILLNLQKEYDKMQILKIESNYKLTGDQEEYNRYLGSYAINPNLEVRQPISLRIPKGMEPTMGFMLEYQYGLQYDGMNYSRFATGLNPAMQMLKYYNATGDVVDGLIPTLTRSFVLSDNDVAFANQIKTQFETKLAKGKTTYEADLAAYGKAREGYIAAAAAYGFDWTLVNSSTTNHLWTPTKKAVDLFYSKYDKALVADPLYEATAAELMAVATQIAGYLKKRVTLTCEYHLDPLVVLDPLNPTKQVRLSTVLISTGAEADDYRKGYLITQNAGRTVMGNSERLTWNVNVSQNPDPEKYSNTLGDLATTISNIYGLSYYNNSVPMMLIDLNPAKDLTITPNNPVYNYASISENNYNVTLKQPINNLPYTSQDGQQQTLTNLSYGSLFDYLTLQAATTDLTMLIATQEGVKATIASAETQYAALKANYEKIFEVYTKSRDQYNALFGQYSDFCHQYLIDWEDTTITLAEAEYRACQQMFTTLDNLIAQAKIDLSDGTSISTQQLDQAIKNAELAVAETTPNGLYEALEQTKVALEKWEKFGLSNNTSADAIRARISELEAQLAEAQAEFDRCTALKDKIIALMKAE